MNLRLHHLRLFAPPARLLCTCMLLASCAGAPQPVTQQIDIPVFTPCVKEVPTRPDYGFDKLPMDAPDGAKVLALARDWPRGRTYESRLEAILAGCL